MAGEEKKWVTLQNLFQQSSFQTTTFLSKRKFEILLYSGDPPIPFEADRVFKLPAARLGSDLNYCRYSKRVRGAHEKVKKKPIKNNDVILQRLYVPVKWIDGLE